MGDNSDANEWHVVLTPHEYDTALRTCWAQIQRADTQAHDDTTEITWQLCNDDHVVDKGIEPLQPEQLPYLRILKRFDALEEKVESTRESSCGVAEAGEMSYEPEVVEDEDEQVIKQFQNSASTIGLQQQTLETQHIRDSPRVQFEVHYHSVYQVPVLYFILLDFPEDKRDIDAVYQYVLLRDWKDMLTEVGVMGGLTYAEMPITGQPCFFIHPCLTAEALQEVKGGRKLHLKDYFQVWFGVVGAPLGIFLPLDESASAHGGLW